MRPSPQLSAGCYPRIRYVVDVAAMFQPLPPVLSVTLKGAATVSVGRSSGSLDDASDLGP